MVQNDNIKTVQKSLFYFDQETPVVPVRTYSNRRSQNLNHEHTVDFFTVILVNHYLLPMNNFFELCFKP